MTNDTFTHSAGTGAPSSVRNLSSDSSTVQPTATGTNSLQSSGLSAQDATIKGIQSASDRVGERIDEAGEQSALKTEIEGRKKEALGDEEYERRQKDESESIDKKLKIVDSL